jgi:hypothetical protein
VFKLIWVLFWSLYAIGGATMIVFALKNLLFLDKPSIAKRLWFFLKSLLVAPTWPLYAMSANGRKFIVNTVNFK